MKDLFKTHSALKSILIIAISIMFMTYQSNAQQLKPSNSGYAPVNGIKIYYEVYLPAGQAGGEGNPLILLHGAFYTINMNWGQLIPELSRTRKVIAIEMPGHGHTPYSDRKLGIKTLAKDVEKLMDYLKIDSATWSGPAPLTTAFNGSFIPGVTTPGTYTYSVPGVPPCAAATAQATVSVVQPPNAGTSRTITVCDNATGFPMVDSLGGDPDFGGAWALPPPGDVSNGFFTPGTSLPGAYTYTVSGTTPCPNAVATLNVNVNPRANAGNDANLSVCSKGGARSMFPLLGAQAQAGGTLRRQSTGAAHSGVFLPGTDAPGVYVYTVLGPIGCQPDEAFVAVMVNQQPNAGFNGQTIVCDDDDPLQLVSFLNGSPQFNGSWIAPDLQISSGIYIPGTSLPGVYTYTVPGSSPCTNAQAQVNVIENDRPDAGNNGVRTVCSSDAIFSLFTALTGTPDQGGVWTGPSGTVVGSDFTPGTSPPGMVYKYRIQGLAPCESDSATATIIVNQAANAGITPRPSTTRPSSWLSASTTSRPTTTRARPTARSSVASRAARCATRRRWRSRS